MRFPLLATLLLFLSCMLAVAQDVSSVDTRSQRPGESFVPNHLPTLHVTRLDGTINVDGDLDDSGWRNAARAENFCETFPGDGTCPSVNTEAFLTYDDNNLYVGFICHDDPSKIRATLHERDGEWSEDMIGIILDTYGNSDRVYEIFTNARGVQGDLLWTTQNEDASFDLVFTSQAKITFNGYQVEMAIPFSSLRFPNTAVQTWKANFWRIHPRDSRREYSWTAIGRDDPCTFCQYGALTGIENVKPGGSIELLPSVIASQSGVLGDNGDLVNAKPEFDASLGMRYAFTPSISAEATVNPDFSQVESDAAQIDVNSTFALFYPERRPFFQEGGELFNTWINAVYTRSINAPLVATKLIGRVGSTSIGYIGAYDRNTPLLLPFEEFSALASGHDTVPDIRSFSNILRIRHSFSDNSFVGVLATDSRFTGGGSGSVVGADALVRFLNNYKIRAQLVASHTAEPNNTLLTDGVNDVKFDDGRHTAAFDGEQYWGDAIYLAVARDARTWNFNLEYWDKSPTFRAANGYISQNSRRQIEAWTGYNLYPDISFIDKLNPNIDIARVFDYHGVRKDEWLRPALDLNLKGQTNVTIAYIFSNELFRGREFSGIRRMQLDVNSNFSNEVGGGFWFSPGRFIARGISEPVLGSGMEFNMWATIKPTEQLNIQPNFWYSTLSYPEGHERAGEEIFSESIYRVRFNYQFTRELSLRLVGQYFTGDKSISIEPLLTYKLNPFTIFYIGSSHALIDQPDPQGLMQLSRQFFAKLQYLVQV